MNLSLRYKAAVLIATTELLLLGLLLFSNAHNSRNNMEHQLVTQAQATAELVAASATTPLLALDLAQLQNQLDGVIGKYNVEYVSILDHQGRVLARAGTMRAGDDAVEARHTISVADALFGEVRLTLSRDAAEAMLKKNTQFNMVIVGLEILLVAVISITLGWFLTRKLSWLIEGTQSIEHGDYSVRLPVQSGDEIGTLTKHFNHMVARLHESIEALESSNKRFRDMADNTSDWIWEIDTDNRYTYCSNQVGNLIGYTPEQVTGQDAFDFMDNADRKRLQLLFQEAREDGRAFYGFEYTATRKDGATVVLESNGVPITDRQGKLIGYRGITRDVTRRKEDASRLVYLSEHDPLTGLMSRHKFLEALEDEADFCDRSGLTSTVLLVDLDGFKLINDTHGHMVGDALLKLVSEILKNETETGTYLARLGGDEFAVLLRGQDSIIGKALAKRLLSAIDAAPLAIDNNPVRVTAGVGVCTCPEDGRTGEQLLAHADAALSHAKSMGHNRYYLYRGSDRDIDSMRDAVNWRTLIHEALSQQRLFLEYQPIMATSGQAEFQKYEALVRIHEPGGGTTAAGQFIRFAEQTGQISDIDKWVLSQVIELLKHKGNQNLCIAVNISGRSLETPGFCDFCEKLAFDSAIDPRQLVFEITETTAIAEMARAENFIMIMKRLGYRFSLDDFGVGFSSFSYLKHLPVDQIKIDGSFIRHLASSREDQIFVDAIVRVARGLGLETVAEFVESEEGLKILVQLGVDNVQGHYIGMANKVPSWPEIGSLSEKQAGGHTGKKPS